MTNRQLRACVLALLLTALLLVWLGRWTNADLFLADQLFDFGSNTFPHRTEWFFEHFTHHTMKALMLGAALVPAMLLVADGFNRWQLFDSVTRRKLAVVVASAILVPVAISALKTVSIHHCPWNLSRYGGFAPYLRLFDSLPAGVSAGHCFPAGHASSALWLASIAVFWLPGQPLKACAAFAAGLSPGLALGLAQQARGAHFLSHTLWSAWVAALIVVMLARHASVRRLQPDPCHADQGNAGAHHVPACQRDPDDQPRQAATHDCRV
jgi:membrane-associated PAP2 superfamily phosphatase